MRTARYMQYIWQGIVTPSTIPLFNTILAGFHSCRKVWVRLIGLLKSNSGNQVFFFFLKGSPNTYEEGIFFQEWDFLIVAEQIMIQKLLSRVMQILHGSISILYISAQLQKCPTVSFFHSEAFYLFSSLKWNARALLLPHNFLFVLKSLVFSL